MNYNYILTCKIETTMVLYHLFNVTLTSLLMDIEEVIHIIRIKYQNKKKYLKI